MSDHNSSALPVAGDHAILARRYVGALFSSAEQEGLVDTVVADMLALRHLWDESPEWRFVASDPRLGQEATAKAAADVAKLANVSKITANFLGVVAQNRRLGLLPLLIKDFFDEVESRRGEFHADVRVARPLTPAQQDHLASTLTSAAGGKVHMTVVEDASLIGGLTVKLGSRFIDASVRAKLDRLERSLREAGAAA